jgi:hypothetical protein
LERRSGGPVLAFVRSQKGTAYDGSATPRWQSHEHSIGVRPVDGQRQPHDFPELAARVHIPVQLAGLLTPLAYAAVVSVMLVAGILAHRPNGFFVFKDGYESVLVLAVISLVPATPGPGRLSLGHASSIQ